MKSSGIKIECNEKDQNINKNGMSNEKKFSKTFVNRVIVVKYTKNLKIR